MCYLNAALVAVLVATAPAPAVAKKKPPPPNEVEVRLVDRSRVRMTILQENLEVVTRYGKLTVPSADIRRIEFGVRASEEAARQMEAAIKKLGNPAFKERETATEELVAIGAPAFLALQRAAASKELEVATRSKAALERIRQKLPEDLQHAREDDLIQTAEFTIIGRITAKTIRATTPIFGESQLRVSDLRGIRWLGCQAEVEISLDATKYANGSQWLNTAIEIGADEELELAATGQVDLMSNNPGQFVTGPAGNAQWGRGPTPHPPGSLLGRIGETGAVFVIGENYKGTVKKDGRLYLQIAQGPWGHNPVSGNFRITIKGGRDTNEH